MEMAKADTRRWADEARAQILGLPSVPARSAFEALCEFVVERTG
jgi:heptaprenyl diphosphate synthase